MSKKPRRQNMAYRYIPNIGKFGTKIKEELEKKENFRQGVELSPSEFARIQREYEASLRKKKSLTQGLGNDSSLTDAKPPKAAKGDSE